MLVADEALVRVWLTWRRPVKSREAWALAIAKNLALDVLRRSRESPDELGEYAVPLWSSTVDTEKHLELRETLQYAAEELPAREFATVLLQVFGYSTTEVSDRLGGSPDSIRRNRSNGRKRLTDWRARGNRNPRTSGPGDDPAPGGAAR